MGLAKCNIAAVDPGRDKCGLAVLGADGGIIHREVVLTSDLLPELQNKKRELKFDKLIIGNGTTSKEMGREIGRKIPDVQVIEVDEYNTTQLAKREYWKLTPPAGWRKLIPVSLLEPPVPVDDVVAVILGRRYLNEGE